MPELTVPKAPRCSSCTNSSEPSFVESDVDHDDANRAALSDVNSYADISWVVPNVTKPATATGCLLKVLKFDPRSRALTFLYVLSPEFRQDNISYHDSAEESYHVWATSWIMQFGDLPTDGYFWRPAYVNHGPLYSKRGCIALGRTDSVLFNHYHFNPWTNTEENKERAAARHAAWYPELYEWILARDHNHPHPHDFELDGGFKESGAERHREPDQAAE
jgi:hypothetical protein